MRKFLMLSAALVAMSLWLPSCCDTGKQVAAAVSGKDQKKPVVKDAVKPNTCSTGCADKAISEYKRGAAIRDKEVARVDKLILTTWAQDKKTGKWHLYDAATGKMVEVSNPATGSEVLGEVVQPFVPFEVPNTQPSTNYVPPTPDSTSQFSPLPNNNGPNVPAEVLSEAKDVDLGSEESRAIIGEIMKNDWRNPPQTANRCLCMGDNYPGLSAQLKQCVNDMLKMSVVIVRYKIFTTSEIVYLFNENDTKINIEVLAAWAKENKQKHDRRWMLRSSHGAEDTDKDGKIVQVIVTYDMIAKNDWSTATEVSLDYWRDWSASIPADDDPPLIAFDCCHAGGAFGKPLLRPGHIARSTAGPDYVTKRVNDATKTRTMRGTLDSFNVCFIPMCEDSQLSEESSDVGGAGFWSMRVAIQTLGLQAKNKVIVKQMRTTLKNNGYGQRPECRGRGADVDLVPVF